MVREIDGVLACNTKFITKFFGITSQQVVINKKRDGFPKELKRDKQGTWFNLEHIMDWHFRLYMNYDKSNRTNNRQKNLVYRFLEELEQDCEETAYSGIDLESIEGLDELEYKQLVKLELDEIEKLSKIIELKKKNTERQIQEIKKDTEQGLLVKAENLDRAMSELAIIHKTDMINQEQVLPTILEGKNSNEILEELRQINFDRLEFLSKIIKKGAKWFKDDDYSLYEVVQDILNAVNNGKTFKELKKCLNT